MMQPEQDVDMHVQAALQQAIEECIKEYYPGVDVNIEHAEGLAECRKTLLLAKAGKMNGCLIEGMGMPGRMRCRSRN